ncbi:glycosyltransferase [Peribacillus glennii]|uniref:Colanic acid biosynthesis glycosyltransferase WcaL n=1 Tax=Peribacillus glennii TaxID=2303991 RepID=A0A372L7N7_9BACI|nr:glycosyltransferase [Peribacillus glennii]RFU61296.1 colanic acid biosynthesis glycosyltransferase WcaL [Peribacillus glennii]
MSRVAVVRGWYLPISETFIYSELVNVKSVSPIVCCKKIMNLEHFPFEPIHQYKDNDELMHILRTQKISLIHARFGVTGADLLEVKKVLGIPMLTSFHGFDLPTNLKSMQRYGNRLEPLFEHGDAFTVTSVNMKNILVKYGCSPEKIFVHHSGINVGKFSYKKRSVPENGIITVLSVGRLIEKKGMEYLIEAVHQVHQEYPGIRLRIAGDGKLRRTLEKQVERLLLGEVVEFLGEVTHQAVAEEMEKAQLFALASTTDNVGNQEGIPNVLKEAMACGLPVLSTNHAGIPELVVDGKSGLLVPERDSAALAERLLHFIQHPEDWERFGTHGRETVEQFFNIERQIENLEAIYSSLLSK